MAIKEHVYKPAAIIITCKYRNCKKSTRMRLSLITKKQWDDMFDISISLPTFTVT